MNKKQLVVVWIIAMLLSIGAIVSTYKITYKAGGPSILDDKGWYISSTHNPYLILANLIKYILPVLIIGITLIYTLRDKKK